jgi:hypothetical protein
MSLMVLEALARGRYVAWKYAVPGVTQVAVPEDTFRYLSELLARQATGMLGLNTNGFQYVRSTYDEREVSLNLERYFEEAVHTALERRTQPRQVAISGLDIFATDVAALNNQLGTGWNAQVLQFENRYGLVGSLYSLARADVWYTVGTPTVGRSFQVLANVLRKPRVMHWVGTDIDAARRRPEILDALQRPWITHVTEVEWEADELRELGVRAQIAPLPPRIAGAGQVPPLPDRFTLLIYLPRSKQELYGSNELKIIIDALKGRSMKFLVVGGGEAKTHPGIDLENLGWCYSLENVYERSSALLRLTPRDGLSLMVLEALAYGRHVLWTKEFPYVTKVSSIKAVIAALNELLILNEAGMLKPQLEAARFVQTVYDRKRCVSRLASVWGSACGDRLGRTLRDQPQNTQ